MRTTPKRRKRAKLVSKSRWAVYAAAGAASAITCPNAAEADIIHVPVGQKFNAIAAGTSVSQAFFMGTGPSAGFAIGHYQVGPGAGAAAFYILGAGTAMFGGLSAGPYKYVAKHSTGQVSALATFINNAGVTATMAFGGGYANSQWLSPGPGFIGFKFNAGGGTRYGWARVTMDGAPANSFTLVDYAYGAPGDPIAFGQVPEPGSLGLLALGAVGLLAWRRKRLKKAA